MEHNNNTYELLREMVQLPTTTNGNKVDCLGMTPLHVLACFDIQDLRLYRCLIESYSEFLITKDKWGDIPIVFVLLSEPPMEIIHLMLATSRKSGDYVRYTIKAQRMYFPELKINWQHIIDESLSASNILIKAVLFSGSSV